MKVLMFGWEYPPHISGGLGTACAGLTRALEKQDVEVLFVVPKLHGGEQAERTQFLSASQIPIKQQRFIANNESALDSTGKAPVSPSFYSTGSPNTPGSTLKTIEVPSFLNPYTLTSTPETIHGIKQWNYAFESEKRDEPKHAHIESGQLTTESRRIEYVNEGYAFSGTYGTNLLEEVDRYADVGAEIAKTYSFDVIHAHDWMTYKAGMAASMISGKPLIVHVHATEVDRSGNVNSNVFQIEKEGMLFAHTVVTVSAWTKNIAVKHYGVDEQKIEVVHNGISPKENAPPQHVAPPLGARMVTFFGRITHQKGPMYFVEAARKVHEKFPDVHFVVAGSGDLLPDMIQRIAQLRLSKHFHFTGFIKGEDIDRVWGMSSVYVMPSVSEPFGIAPLEAIQAGVPVILSKQAGVSEVMSHAIKVDFWNSDELAEAVCNVLRFKSLANTLKVNGEEEVKQITWDKAAKKLTNLYHDLISKHEKQEEPGFLFSGASTEKTAHPAIL